MVSNGGFEVLPQRLEHEVLEINESWWNWVIIQLKLWVVDYMWHMEFTKALKEGQIMLGMNMSNPNLPNTNSQDDSIKSSIEGSKCCDLCGPIGSHISYVTSFPCNIKCDYSHCWSMIIWPIGSINKNSCNRYNNWFLKF